MKDAKAHLDNQLPNSSFEFGLYISNGFEIWKKNIPLFMAFMFCFIVISLMLVFIPFIGQLASSWLVGPALTAGVYIFAHKLFMNERAEFGDFFSGFDNASNIIIAYLIMTVVGVAFVIPLLVYLGVSVGLDLFNADTNDPDFLSNLFTPGLLGVFAIYGIIGAYLGVLVSFTVHFITFYKLSGWDAIVYSAKYVHKHLDLCFPLDDCVRLYCYVRDITSRNRIVSDYTDRDDDQLCGV